MTSERAVLLIADIGGYTEYMSTHRMSLAHAEVNTGRLLEKVIDAAPGLELIEVEGDAAFLWEREYVARNLCPCKGCKEAANLTLKFVAHVGDVATQTIRQRLKLVGIDVILVHRLLKNPVTVREYVLLSADLYGTGSSVLDGSAHEIEADAEGIGRVRAFYVDVTELDAPV